MLRAHVLIIALVLAACSSNGQATGDGINVTVHNEYAARMTAYIAWNNNDRRIRLGEISSGRSRTFKTPRRGTSIAFGAELTSTPSPGTTAGPTAFQGGRPAGIASPYVQSESIDILPSEDIVWTVTATGGLLFGIQKSAAN